MSGAAALAEHASPRLRAVQIVALGPHRLNRHLRPPWFFQRDKTRRAVRFLAFTGSTDAEIVSAAVGNFAAR